MEELAQGDMAMLFSPTHHGVLNCTAASSNFSSTILDIMIYIVDEALK